MKADLQNKNYYCNTFQEVHAPQALAGKVFTMTKHKQNNLTFIKKLSVTAASLAILFLGSNAIIYAATGTTWIRGVFKDTVRWDGAITGTEYITAPQEIDITIAPLISQEDTCILPVEITLHTPDQAPFLYIDSIALGNATLTDNIGNETAVLATSENLTYFPITDGKVQITLPLPGDKLQTDTGYTLHITSLYGSAKADSPLLIHGNWKCTLQ